MTVEILTLNKPSRCAASVNAHDMFIFDGLTLKGNEKAIARLKIAARERDKWFILQHNQKAT